MPDTSPVQEPVPADAAETEARPAEDAPAAGGAGPTPWPLRLALVAASGVVVGGVAFGAVGIASALSDASEAAGSGSGATSEPASERRTTALTGPDPTARADEEGRAEQAGEADTSAREEGAADAPVAGGGAPEAGGGTVPSDTGGDGPGGTDPRAEILDDTLNSPQERPPMEPLVSQEDVDAEREAAEAEVEPVVP